MNRYKGTKCFLYITPYLTEVDRICEQCDFEEPDSDYLSKSTELKELMRSRCNIASTHALFSMMDDESLEIAKDQGYCLIIDESIQTIQGVAVSPKDKNILLQHLMEVNDDFSVSWLDSEYEGKFEGYKQMAESGTLYYYANTLYEVMNPNRLTPFSEVFMLTYLFDGQPQKAYLDYFGFTYDTVGIVRDENGYQFSDKPDEPPPVDYSDLVRIIGADGKDVRMNDIGYGRTALSVSWFKQRGRNHDDVKALRRNLDTFFRTKTKDISGQRLWTTYKESLDWMLGSKNRYATSFLSLNARATNAYKEANSVAYLVNRFVDPNISKFFAEKDIEICPNKFALSEMLQFIWRSAIRDDREIFLYIPSRRMRELLTEWITKTNNGGTNSD
jgi:hypothetical protein